VLSGAAACSLSTGAGFASTITSFALDAGFAEGRAWADVNGDGRSDYCRRVGGAPETLMQCTLSSGTGFGQTFTSGRVEWGADSGYAWVDFDGDGDRDFCRPTGSTATNQLLFCTLWTPGGLGETKVSTPIDWGYGTDRAWVDHNGDGKFDYCRRVGGGAGNERVSCTISNGSGFGALPVPRRPSRYPRPPRRPRRAPRPARAASSSRSPSS